MTRQYTNEFKAQVLKEVQEVGNAALVARRYELSKNTVYTWMLADADQRKLFQGTYSPVPLN